MEVKEIDIKILKPAEYNPRKINAKQYRDIKDSLERFGFVNPIVVNTHKDRENVVVGGNQRLKVWGDLGHTTVPVYFVDLPFDKEQELNIRLNKNSAEFDMELLHTYFEKDALVDWGFDMADLVDGNFNTDAVDINAEEAPAEIDIDTKGGFTLELLAQCFDADISVVSALQLVQGVISRSMAMGQFNKLCKGKDTGYYISALFNPHRFETRCGRSKYSLVEAQNVADFRRIRAQHMAKYHDVDILPNFWIKYASIGFAGVQLAFEFQPSIARDIYLKYCPVGGRVLDPCHGWGGRVVGWLSANLKGHYVGFDPSTRTHQGVANLIDFLKQSETKSTAESICLPFEDAELEKESFDLALTSPPYFDTEQYADEETQSCKRYPTYDEWVVGFLEPLIIKTMTALKNTGKFILNIGNVRYTIKESVQELCSKQGYKYSLLHDYKIGGCGIGERSDTEDTKGEPFILIEKS